MEREGMVCRPGVADPCFVIKRIKPHELTMRGRNNRRLRTGAGGFSSVYAGVYRHEGRDVPVAVKYYKERLMRTEQDVERFFAEALGHYRLSQLGLEHSANIVQFFGVLEHANQRRMKRAIVMQRMRRSLADLIFSAPSEPRRLFPVEPRLRMLTQIAHALAVMHEHCYQHLDVKPENALLDDDDNAYISDFGLSRLRTPTAGGAASRPGYAAAGTPGYICPEVGRGVRARGPASDVFAFGILAWEVLALQRAWHGRGVYVDPDDLNRRVCCGERPDAKRLADALSACPAVSDLVRCLLPRCWSAEADSRPTARQVCDALNSVVSEVDVCDQGAVWLDSPASVGRPLCGAAATLGVYLPSPAPAENVLTSAATGNEAFAPMMIRSSIIAGASCDQASHADSIGQAVSGAHAVLQSAPAQPAGGAESCSVTRSSGSDCSDSGAEDGSDSGLGNDRADALEWEWQALWPEARTHHSPHRQQLHHHQHTMAMVRRQAARDTTVTPELSEKVHNPGNGSRSEVHRAAALAVALSVPEMGMPDVDAGLSTQLLHQKASSIPTLADGWSVDGTSSAGLCSPGIDGQRTLVARVIAALPDNPVEWCDELDFSRLIPLPASLRRARSGTSDATGAGSSATLFFGAVDEQQHADAGLSPQGAPSSSTHQSSSIVSPDPADVKAALSCLQSAIARAHGTLTDLFLSIADETWWEPLCDAIALCRQLRRLQVSAGAGSTSTRGVCVLVLTTMRLPRLAHLSLTGVNLSQIRTVYALASALPELRCLTGLDLFDTGIVEAGFAVLGPVIATLVSLERLDIGCNPEMLGEGDCSDDLCDMLENLEELRCLGLSGLGLDDSEAEALSEVLMGFSLLETCDLSDNQLTNASVRLVTDALLGARSPPELRHLNLSYNELTAACFPALLQFLRDATRLGAQLQVVSLEGNAGIFSRAQARRLRSASPPGCTLALP